MSYLCGAANSAATIVESKLHSNQSLQVKKGDALAEKYAEKGEVVYDGTLLFAIADPTRLWIMMNVAEADINRHKPGQAITLVADTYPEERFEGKLVFVAPDIDPKTRTVQMRVDVANPDRKLKVGMHVRELVVKEKAADARP